MRNRLPVITIIFALFLVGALQGTARAEDWKNPPSEQDISRVRKKIETLRAWKLTEFLNLDEQTSARLFPAMREADEGRQKIEAENRKLVRRMAQILKSDDINQAEIAKILDRLQKNRREEALIEERHFKKVRSILSPADTARYILFQIRFQQEIRKRIAQSGRDGRNSRDSGFSRDGMERGGTGSRGGSSGGGRGR
ncbi:MAG: periplasmic heavy metal sensor [Deltaproteobacteria bacterium]|nr:periplasmic heavy metal sensor [Deltaproteobacteria bacterium]